ncbi:uncharacterized protein with ParB-like and HNH nuclease domain [Priestia megaterium]|uniref:DUF262 domain-containing protein n=1 Tax=Priestia megaterium TaxID=1404 RepID=UPI003D21655E
MELHAVPKTIKDIFASDKIYIVPRFQREYSWTADELNELWKDILINIGHKDGGYTVNEYFIGSLVLIGGHTSSQYEIVDGQQRLTSITILLSALVETYSEIGAEKSAKGCYTFVEGTDSDFNEFFRLENERSSDFIKRAIQHKEKAPLTPSTTEEKNLMSAYDFFRKKLRDTNLIKEINDFLKLSNEISKDIYITYLNTIREQVLQLKTIYITVSDKDEAYNIFETLNAKGLDLSIVDLIKNQIFKVLKDQHPTDYAKNEWKKMQLNLNERQHQTDLNTFFRHYWVSKYEHITESKIYKSFTTNIARENKKVMKLFLDNLVEESFHYKIIASPQPEDWTQQEEKEIYKSLLALSLFRVVSPRPLLLALLMSRKKKKISQNFFRGSLKAIEHFHFTFSTICSSNASGLERMYSSFARKIRKANNKNESHAVIRDLITTLSQKKPSLDKFTTSFDKKLKYSDRYTKDKKIIQYFFKKLESHYLQTNELEVLNISIEHILPQASQQDIAFTIGNLLPLSQDLNVKCGEKVLAEKIPYYEESQFETVKKFLEEHPSKTSWDHDDIVRRTNDLAILAYNEIFTISSP